jgi:excisionase family DNA binding protein
MQTIADERPYLRIGEVAKELGVSPDTIRRKIASGELPATQLGGPGFDGQGPARRARGVADQPHTVMSDEERLALAGYTRALWFPLEQRYLPPGASDRTVTFEEALAELDEQERE